MRKAFLALFRLAAVFLSCLFLSGKAAAADGPFALNFDGVDDYVAIRHSTFFNSHQLTLTAWVRTINTVGERGLINKYAANSLNGWNVFLFNGEVRAWYFRDSANFIWDGGRGLNGGFIADGEWHHIAFVVNSTEGRLYVDGLPVDARFWDGSFGDATTMQEVRLGSYPGSGFFNGRLDEVTIWGRALSATEISASRSNSLVGSEAALNGYYRIAEGTGITARNSGGSGFLFDGALMNGPAWVVGLVLKPGALTLSASTITTNSAVLNGTVSPGGTNANGWFEWGATTNYGNVTPPRPLGGGANSTNFSQSLTGLTFGTIIHFRAMASNGLGMAFGANQGFRTLGLSVETLPATSVTQTSATLNALSNPGGASAIGWFEWGTTTNFGNVTPPQSLGSANAPTNFSQVVTGLSGGVHHFRAVASNSFGLAFGGNQRFPAQIVINEFVNDQRSATGGQVADAREFVELYNAGTAPVNLSGWFVRIVDLTDGVVRFDIPFESGTSLASGSYYVLGQADGVSNVNFDFGMNDVLPNGHAMVLELRDNSEILVDAVACQMFLAHSNATPEQIAQFGTGFYGQLISTDVPAPNAVQSWGRWLDGRDTDNNGWDFGIIPATPGVANNLPQVSAHSVPDLGSLAHGSPVPGYSASFVLPRAIDPSTVDSVNPRAVTPPPGGGKAIIAWDDTGGGNATYARQLVSSFDLHVYLDTGPLGIRTGDSIESTVYGIGTTDMFFGTPDPTPAIFSSSASLENSSTGIGWVYQRRDTTNDTSNFSKLFLVDFGPSGNPRPTTAGGSWNIIEELNVRTLAPGWYRLTVDYDAATGQVLAVFGDQMFTFTSVSNLVGTFYVGYRTAINNFANNLAAHDPPTFIVQHPPGPRPALAIEQIAPTQVRLLWPTNDPAFGLQFNTNPNATNWSSVASPPIVVGTNNVVTNEASGAQKFYRLIK